MGPETENVSQPPPQNEKMNWSWSWLVEPSRAIHDPENCQRARLQSTLLLVLFILLAAGLTAVTIQRTQNGEGNTNIFVITTVSILFAYGLSRTRYYYAAGILALLASSFLPFGEILAYHQYGNVGITLMWLILPMLLGTVLLRLRDQMLLVGIDVLGLMLLALTGPQSAYYSLMVIGGLILSTSGLLIVIEIYRRRLECNRQSELLKSNQELESIRKSLRDEVAERTRNAEEAQAQAEAATRTLEAQMWQVSGLAELAKVMRGVQTIPTLAASIMQLVCSHAEIPVGALFISEGDVLFLAGSYAYPFPTTPSPRFRIGSGLVGEAARDRQAISLRDIPEHYLPITSGLGEETPAQILAIPCIYQEQVVGVMELASLEPFTPAQIQFLTSATESIASALQTAQIRYRVDALLVETQQQAEELRTQEEAQRKTNFELDQREAELQLIEQQLTEQQSKLDAMTTHYKESTEVVQNKKVVSDDV
jgi:putative methionine-R-sulfoxide reductase with GAF domain